jgi:hypothetical protein
MFSLEAKTKHDSTGKHISRKSAGYDNSCKEQQQQGKVKR